MHKAIFMLNRAEDLSFEEFRDHWLEEHAPLAEGTPGLVKYTISFPEAPDEAAYDGLAQLYFQDAEALAAGLDSEPLAAATADVPNFADPTDVLQLTVEEHVHLDRT
jgi:uncharacterized protein (TIGR02118 family)